MRGFLEGRRQVKDFLVAMLRQTLTVSQIWHFILNIACRYCTVYAGNVTKINWARFVLLSFIDFFKDISFKHNFGTDFNWQWRYLKLRNILPKKSYFSKLHVFNNAWWIRYTIKTDNRSICELLTVIVWHWKTVKPWLYSITWQNPKNNKVHSDLIP